jgi:hypothetical protein
MGEKARCMSDERCSSSFMRGEEDVATLECDREGERLLGAGIWLGVFGRDLGVTGGAGMYVEREGGK